MPDSGWVTAQLAVRDDSQGGVLAWSNAMGAAGGSGSATVHNPVITSAVTMLLVAYPPPGLVPQGVEPTGIAFEFDMAPSFGGAIVSAFHPRLVRQGAISLSQVTVEPEQSFPNFGLTWRLRYGGDGELFDQAWEPDDFGPFIVSHGGFSFQACAFGIALRLRVAAEKTAYIQAARFRFFWEGGPPLQEIVGEARANGQQGSLKAGANFTTVTAEAAAAGLTGALVSSFARWTSPPIALDPLHLARRAAVSWDETLPGGTAVAVEARLTPPFGAPGGWRDVENGGDLDLLTEAGDLAGQSLELRVTLITTALPATPRVDNLSLQAAGAYGLSAGFHRNPLTGHLAPLSTLTAAEAGDELFDLFVPAPVPLSVYDAQEIDIGFDDRARLWAAVDSRVGPGGGVDLVSVRRFATTRREGEDFPPMHEISIEEAELRYARFRLEVDNLDAGIVVRDFVPTVDLVERTITETVQVAPGGSTIVFPQPFHLRPGVQITCEEVEGAARFGVWENLTTQQVTVHSFDVGGSSAGGPATVTITGV